MSTPRNRPAVGAPAFPAPRPSSLPSPSPLITDAERLASVLERENAALAAHDEAAVSGLLAEKQAACAAFEERMRSLADAGATDSAEARWGASRLQLGTIGERLRQAAAENQRRLSAGIAARKQVLELIATAIRQQNAGASTYARSGVPACSRGRGTAVPPQALSFDRSL